MSTLTVDLLRAIFPNMNASTAETFAPPLAETMDRFDIRTGWRMAAFLAQCAHESLEFEKLEEGLTYTRPERLVQVWPSRFWAPPGAPTQGKKDARLYVRNPERLANFVYENRMGNGPAASGDGYRFRGRGVIQLTGRSNYESCEAALNLGILVNPDGLKLPRPACLSAGWFWKANNLARFADRSDFTGLTKAINGGVHGLAQREAYFEDALDMLA